MSNQTVQNRTTGTPEEFVELNWYTADDTVRVIARDQERFEVQKDHAIECLRLAVTQKTKFENQFRLLLRTLAQWRNKHSHDVANAILTIQDSTLLFVVQSSGSKFNEELTDSLSSLDLQIANDPALTMIRLNTLVLPPVSDESLMSFLDKRLLVKLGDSRESHCVS